MRCVTGRHAFTVLVQGSPSRQGIGESMPHQEAGGMLWRIARATGNPEPQPPKHVELFATRILRAMSYVPPCFHRVGPGFTFTAWDR
jgi:hypothetical protein